MRLKVVVSYGPQTQTVTVACGEGRQTIKWLATVATQRMARDSAPNGCLRHREARGCIVPSDALLLPSEVTTDEESFYHPEAKLSDCFVDGQLVHVKVAKKATPKNEGGDVSSSRWSLIANSHSERLQPKRAKALEEVYQLRDERLRQKELEEEERKLTDNRSKANLMRSLIAQQLISAEQLEEAMRMEWERMNRRGLMDSWIRAERERDKVYAKLRDNFLSLLELFRFYGASTTSAADAHLMEFVEFCAFCRDIDLFGGTNDLINHTTLAGAFAEIAGIDVSEAKHAHFEFGDFLASLIWLALTTKGGLGSTKKSSAIKTVTSKEAIDSARRTIMRNRDLTNVGSAFSTAQALQQLFDDNLAQAFRIHQGQLIGSITKETLATDEILAILYVHKDQLETVFKTYLASKQDYWDNNFQLDVGYMTLNEYLVLLEDSKLIGSSNDDSSDLLTLKEVRQAFAGAQDDIVVVQPTLARNASHRALSSSHKQLAAGSSAADKGAAANGPSQSMLLSFAEFLEAILRLALLKWEDDTYCTVQKLTMAIETILANVYSTANSRPALQARGAPSKPIGRAVAHRAVLQNGHTK